MWMSAAKAEEARMLCEKHSLGQIDEVLLPLHLTKTNVMTSNTHRTVKAAGLMLVTPMSMVTVPLEMVGQKHPLLEALFKPPPFLRLVEVKT